MAYAPRSGGPRSGPGGAPRSGGEGGEGDRRRGRRRDENRDNRNDREGGDEFKDKLVTINRVAKVVKGGRRFSFAALVVVGDEKGRVGWGAGKAREVPEAIRKATERAKRGMIRVPMREGRTLHHDVIGEFGAGRVILRAAPAGTGIIAGGPMRAVFEVLGMNDVVAKCTGTTNPHNMVKATFAGLARSTSPRAVAARRGKKVSDLLPQPKAEAANTAETVTEAPNV
ncbi:30S ribosomal protein S5 [Roseomonas sp. CCTCC AB2023176]|uniref:30S ribosomal protein S5 n=1 Tax=Roseomonas sp. CCTCC AB2023176 TaxID=3342640 RepID=UPI0035D97542